MASSAADSWATIINLGWGVAGWEADIQGVSDSGRNSVSVQTPLGPAFPTESYTGTISATRSLDYLGTVRGRLGWLATPTLLVYATGGLAYGGVQVSNSFAFQESLGAATLPPVNGTSSASTTRTGWTVGGCTEWILDSHWSAKFEYLFYDLGSEGASVTLAQFNTNFPGAPYHTTLVQSSTHFEGNIVRVGLNYQFH
jgi:outer membrane immunogenic protein